jgi:hypothetical protein
MLAFNLLNKSRFNSKPLANLNLKFSKLFFRNFFSLSRMSNYNSFKTIRNSSNFTKFSYKPTFKTFSESQQSNERTFYFTEQEAYSMNEHDRMILQLDSGSVPLTTLPKFMKELGEYCFLLSKYKEYTKGWKYVSNFFYSNLTNFTNEDFIFYTAILSYTLYRGNQEDFWEKIAEEFSRRTWDKKSFLELVNCFNISGVKGHSFWKTVVDKLNNYSLDTFTENILIAAILGNVEYTAEDPIWATLLSRLENEEIKEETFDLAMVMRAAVSIKERLPERKTGIYDKIKRHFEDNFSNFPPDALYSIFNEYIKLFEPNGEEVSKYVILIADKIGAANDYMRFGFIHQLLILCNKYREIIPTLNQNKHILPNSFAIPTDEMVGDYAQALNATIYNPNNLQKGAETYYKFWEKYAEIIGLNVDFAKDMLINGPANYEAFTETFPHKAEQK